MTSLMSVGTSGVAQLSQKRACPHGTNANPLRDAIKHTSQESDSSDALVTGDGDASAIDGVIFGGVACSSLLSLLVSSHGCRASACTPIEWLTARKYACIRAGVIACYTTFDYGVFQRVCFLLRTTNMQSALNPNRVNYAVLHVVGSNGF